MTGEAYHLFNKIPHNCFLSRTADKYMLKKIAVCLIGWNLVYTNGVTVYLLLSLKVSKLLHESVFWGKTCRLKKMQQAEELLHCVLERSACQQDLVLLKGRMKIQSFLWCTIIVYYTAYCAEGEQHPKFYFTVNQINNNLKRQIVHL